MITFNLKSEDYYQYNNAFRANISKGKTAIQNTNINIFEKEGYNIISELKRKLYMDIDRAKKPEIGEMLKKKSSSLPETINSMFYNIGLYMQGEVNSQKFITYYCKQTEPLYWRIAEGAEKEIFKESYAPELKMLIKIRNAINSIKSEKEQNIDKLDEVINTSAREYLKSPISRKKYFAV